MKMKSGSSRTPVISGWFWMPEIHDEDWDILTQSGFLVDQLWEAGLIEEPDDSEEHKNK